MLHTKLLAPGLQDSLQDDTAPGGSKLRVSSKQPEGAVEHMDKQENWETHTGCTDRQEWEGEPEPILELFKFPGFSVPELCGEHV